MCKYSEDSNRFEGAHIVCFAYHTLVSNCHSRLPCCNSVLVNDPFTDPANASIPFVSPSTRTKEDVRRINSLENGILLCVHQWHKDYDNFWFAIHPGDVRTTFL